MAKLRTLMKTLPRLAPRALAKRAPYKAAVRGARIDVPFDQARSHAAAIWPNLAAMEWLEKVIEGLSSDDARKEFEQLSKTRKALVTIGYLIKSKGTYHLIFDGRMYRSRLLMKPVLKSPYEIPVTTFAAKAGEVTA